MLSVLCENDTAACQHRDQLFALKAKRCLIARNNNRFPFSQHKNQNLSSGTKKTQAKRGGGNVRANELGRSKITQNPRLTRKFPHNNNITKSFRQFNSYRKHQLNHTRPDDSRMVSQQTPIKHNRAPPLILKGTRTVKKRGKITQLYALGKKYNRCKEGSERLSEVDNQKLI